MSAKIKITDLIAKKLINSGLKSAFGLQGGAVVHIFDSLEKAGIECYYLHHEQSAALAATANSKITGQIGCVIVTTGPGCTNAITGLLAAWQDSIPVVFISGQVRSLHTSYGKPVRQVGSQEAPIIDIVRPITKYAKFLNKASEINSEISKAIEIAKSGRPGPVWLDLALDVQWVMIDDPGNEELAKNSDNETLRLTNDNRDLLLKLIAGSSKPLLVLGYGVRLSDSIKEVKKFITSHDLNYVTTWSAMDYFPTSDSRNLGVIGMSGQRGANKAIFASDLLICLGSHLSIPQTTTLTESYAPNAKKVIVDIDSDQLDNLTVSFDLKINLDIKNFLLLTKSMQINFARSKFDGLKEQNWYEPLAKDKINSNSYIKTVSECNSVRTCYVIDGGGTALYAGFQSLRVKKDERVVCSTSISCMGTGLAEIIGAYGGKDYEKYICIIGDGSFLMNVQDLQSIYQYQIPVAIVVVNNNGYLAIRNTQRDFLAGKYYGTHPDWGLVMPNIQDIGMAFKLDYMKVKTQEDLFLSLDKIKEKIKRPIIIELITDENQEALFSQGYKKNMDGTYSPASLSEMKPYL